MRVLIPPESAEVGKRVALEDDERHHLRVRRAREGETVEILDGAGLRGAGKLHQFGRDWQVEVEWVERRPSLPDLVLAVAAGDRDRFTWMVEKAVELGVTRIVPLETTHTAGVATRIRRSHLSRLQRIARETLKQCGADWAPSIEEPVAFASYIRRPREGVAWLADEHGVVPPAALDPVAASIVIGPEGGFTEEERGAILDAGYQPVSLGPHTLRYETAAIAAATAVFQARQRGQHG